MACLGGCETKTEAPYRILNLQLEQRLRHVLDGEEDREFTCYLEIKHKEELLQLYNDLKGYYDVNSGRDGVEAARHERGLAFKKIVEKWIDSQTVYVPHDVLRNVDACKPDEHTNIFKLWYRETLLLVEKEWLDFCRLK
jgi:hypothetical protein